MGIDITELKTLNQVKLGGPFVPGLKMQAQNTNEQTMQNYHINTERFRWEGTFGSLLQSPAYSKANLKARLGCSGPCLLKAKCKRIT